MSTKMILRSIILTIVVGLTSQVCLAQKRGPSTPEERAQAVRLTRALEADPLNKDAKSAREWLTLWLVEVPDISVTLCTDYLSGLYEKKKDRDKNYAPEIATQMMFSSAAFMIEHPDQATDDIAVNKAGLEGSLKAYEAILQAKPKVQWAFLDDLIAKRDKGTLEDYVREIKTKKCKGSKE